ncbi:hypothetical protein [Paenibacillus wynnii]|uniref:CN hydrolase domain-containing protein n=1 Tax=Paenibacillus wynnii TaxID=268407 RepID=A0A098M7N8_9BACL|nr:hypothetical protein [Paenibacillus wynnii]KGE18048.1 hypothetical protein PWYN_26260 [Paenibacillus wynnii]
MRLLVAQPNHEAGLEHLIEELKQYESYDAVLYPEGYVLGDSGVLSLCKLAKQYKKLIITGYRDRNNKDRALIINSCGDIILERAKSPMNESLYSPSVTMVDNITIGYLLCVEILQGFAGLEGMEGPGETIDIIMHPIGVGMFSDEQFAEWIEEATKIALKYNAMIIGTSHADGSYRNCGVSIPISYCIDSTGEPIYISKNDTRSRIIHLKTRQFDILGQ